MEGREFDAQVVLSPKSSPRGKLLSEYVRVRIPRMDDVDVALFERDWNNTLYYFVMNSDEQIYLRYGGRDARGPMTYLDLDSIELALKQGLELHEKYTRGELKKSPRPEPIYPRQIPPLVERTFARNQCVECHLIGDFTLMYREQTGKLNKLTDMFRWPDIRNIGIDLDVPKRLIVKEAGGPVKAAGMHPGERLAPVQGTPRSPFGRLQDFFDKEPRGPKRVEVECELPGQVGH